MTGNRSMDEDTTGHGTRGRRTDAGRDDGTAGLTPVRTNGRRRPGTRNQEPPVRCLIPSMLDLKDVSKRYGALTAVTHVSFSIAPGEILGYLGPNGSGKSTTVKMLAGLIPPTAGVIHYKGRDIQEDLLGYKAVVGYVPEEAHVYTHLTAPEYLRMCGRLRGLSPARLEQKIDRFLGLFGLDGDRHAQLSSFSKGMRQKVLLSAALLHRPRVIILDEPVSGLDVSTALVLRGVVKALADAGGVVFYTRTSSTPSSGSARA